MTDMIHIKEGTDLKGKWISAPLAWRGGRRSLGHYIPLSLQRSTDSEQHLLPTGDEMGEWGGVILSPYFGSSWPGLGAYLGGRPGPRERAAGLFIDGACAQVKGDPSSSYMLQTNPVKTKKMVLPGHRGICIPASFDFSRLLLASINGSLTYSGPSVMPDSVISKIFSIDAL